MRNWITRFIREEEGASAAEYALILALVGAAMAFAAQQLGVAIGDRLDVTTGIIDGSTTPTAPAATP